MEPTPVSPAHRWRSTLASRPFWAVAAVLAATALFHYFQTYLLPFPANTFLSRHAVQRIIFVLPIAIATFAFGLAGGLITLALAVLIMLPRAIWLSPYPVDALIETVATAVVGYLLTWMIDAQAREKALRQKAMSRLSAINAITAIVTESLELEQILNGALDKVLEVMGLETGLIFLMDRQTRELVLAAYQGMSKESAAELGRLGPGEGSWGQVAQSGELMVVQDGSQDPPAVQREGLRTKIIVPLKSKDKVQGVLAAATRRLRPFLPAELELITAIGSEIGVAVENARLYEGMRFYARQITQAQEDERKRIARELHDETIQTLIVISRRLEGLATPRQQSPEAAMQRLASLQELIGNTLRDMRRFVQDLRPPTLDHLGLVAAVEGLTSDLTEKDEIETEVRVTGEAKRLVLEEELVLFRIAQEALSNVRRHSGASRVTVHVEFWPRQVRMTIHDNGRGFNAPERIDDLASTGKLGLLGMQERARTLGGTLTVQSEPGQGTVVVVEVPPQPQPEEMDSSAQE